MPVLGEWADLCAAPDVPADLTDAPFKVVSQVARAVTARCGVKLPAILFATRATTAAAAQQLVDGLNAESPLHGPVCRRLLPLRLGDRAAIVLVGPSEPSLLLMRRLARGLDDSLPPGIAVYGVGCYEPYSPGWRRSPAEYTEQLTSVLRGLPPELPLVLVAYSSAGHFGHQAAAALHKEGRSVAVVLLDTYMRVGLRSVLRSPRARIRHEGTGLLLRLPDAIGERVILPRQRRREATLAATGLPVTTEAALLEWHRSRRLTWHHLASRATFPELLLTTSTSQQMLGDPLLGWGAVRQDPGFGTAHVPGNHRTLFDEPHVTEVLGRITEFVVPIVSDAPTAVQ
jgi:thioesterase domain-containing protein